MAVLKSVTEWSKRRYTPVQVVLGDLSLDFQGIGLFRAAAKRLESTKRLAAICVKLGLINAFYGKKYLWRIR